MLCTFNLSVFMLGKNNNVDTSFIKIIKGGLFDEIIRRIWRRKWKWLLWFNLNPFLTQSMWLWLWYQHRLQYNHNAFAVHNTLWPRKNLWWQSLPLNKWRAIAMLSIFYDKTRNIVNIDCKYFTHYFLCALSILKFLFILQSFTKIVK